MLQLRKNTTPPRTRTRHGQVAMLVGALVALMEDNRGNEAVFEASDNLKEQLILVLESVKEELEKVRGPPNPPNP